MNNSLEQLKADILAALAHPEADEGLYLDNLCVVHQEEERRPVRGTPDEALIALQLLIEEGKVLATDNGEKVIFALKR